MSDEGPDPAVVANDALQMARRAQARITDLEKEKAELEQRVDQIERKATASQLRLSEIDDDRDYEDYSFDEKIGIVREHAFKRASDRGGPITIDYNDVQWEAFDGEPGAAHCYKLMKKAAVGAPGFEYFDEPRDSPKSKRLKCDPEVAKAAPAFLAENKAIQEWSE